VKRLRIKKNGGIDLTKSAIAISTKANEETRHEKVSGTSEKKIDCILGNRILRCIVPSIYTSLFLY